MRASRPAPSWLPQWTMTESVVGTSRPAFAGNAGALGMPAGPPPVRPIRYVVSPGTGRRAAASPATASAVTARSWRLRASRPVSASPAQPPRRTALLGAAAGGARRQSPARAPRVRAAVPARGDDPELCGSEGSRRSIRFVPGIGTTSPSWASSRNSASCRRVTPQSPASQRTSPREPGCAPGARPGSAGHGGAGRPA